MHNAMDLIISAYEGSRLNYMGNVYMQPSQRKVLIDEQSTGDSNLLYETMHDVQLKHACAKLSHSLALY
jgi:hypothetical protein